MYGNFGKHRFCNNKAQKAKPLELHPFIAEKLGRAAMQFPEAVLKRNMLELIDADYYLKTGQVGEEILEHVVIDLCCGTVKNIDIPQQPH